MSSKLRVGVAGPVGSGKTALVETLCFGLKKNYQIAVVTNDIYTKEDANFLIKKKVLEKGRIVGVETGGCPHTAIREDCSLNKNAVIDLEIKYIPLDFIFVESGGDNLAASFSPELVDLSIYVIDVSAGDKIPRKGGPGITTETLDLYAYQQGIGLRGEISYASAMSVAMVIITIVIFTFIWKRAQKN